MTAQPERVPPAEVRIGDADRERVARLLHDAAAQGRLDLTELDERLAGVYAAKTYGELVPLTRDLPDTYAAPAAAPAVLGGQDVTERGSAVAVLSGFERKGRWSLSRRFTGVAVLGGGVLDLREAAIGPGRTTIRAFAVLGGIDIVVPHDVNVEVTGVGVLGGFDHSGAGAGRPGGATIVVSGLAVLGGVSVRREPGPAIGS